MTAIILITMAILLVLDVSLAWLCNKIDKPKDHT